MNGFLCEFLVALDVGVPVVNDEGGAVWHAVEQGPEGAVAAAVVVAVKHLWLSVNWDDLELKETC